MKESTMGTSGQHMGARTSTSTRRTATSGGRTDGTSSMTGTASTMQHAGQQSQPLAAAVGSRKV